MKKEFEVFVVLCGQEEYPEVKAILEAQGYKLWCDEWMLNENCVVTTSAGEYMTHVNDSVESVYPRITLSQLREKFNMNITTETDTRGIHTAHLTPLSEDVYLANKAKGFWDGERNKGELLMLVTSELAEALEADRKGNYANASLLNSLFNVDDNERFKEDFGRLVKDTFEDEVSDAVIRLFDLCGGLGIDLGKHVELKLRYNSLRGNKHGKRY